MAIYVHFNNFVEIVVRPMQRENSLATRYEELLRRLAAEITKLRGVENLDVRADGVTHLVGVELTVGHLGGLTHAIHYVVSESVAEPGMAR